MKVLRQGLVTMAAVVGLFLATTMSVQTILWAIAPAGEPAPSVVHPTPDPHP
jgi:hypothetical protein